jgi:hypothetical protein
MLLFAGKYVKADTPCHVALEIQDSTIRSLENRLATAQSLPYNQGYQEGYKVAKEEALITITWSGILTVLKGLVIALVPFALLGIYLLYRLIVK